MNENCSVKCQEVNSTGAISKGFMAIYDNLENLRIVSENIGKLVFVSRPEEVSRSVCAAVNEITTVANEIDLINGKIRLLTDSLNDIFSAMNGQLDSKIKLV
jgi:hypothetical protein